MHSLRPVHVIQCTPSVRFMLFNALADRCLTVCSGGKVLAGGHSIIRYTYSSCTVNDPLPVPLSSNMLRVTYQSVCVLRFLFHLRLYLFHRTVLLAVSFSLSLYFRSSLSLLLFTGKVYGNLCNTSCDHGTMFRSIYHRIMENHCMWHYWTSRGVKERTNCL